MTYLYNALSNLLRLGITLCSMTQSVDHFLKWKQSNLKSKNCRKKMYQWQRKQHVLIKLGVYLALEVNNHDGNNFQEKCRYHVNYELPIIFIKTNYIMYIVVSETKLHVLTSGSLRTLICSTAPVHPVPYLKLTSGQNSRQCFSGMFPYTQLRMDKQWENDRMDRWHDEIW